MRLAAADDLWFHVAQGPGAHVVLRVAGGPPGSAPSDADLEAAAMLAAYHSPQRASSHVAVDQCRAGRLRKPPGGRPGLLVYERERGYAVTPDPARVEAMRTAATPAATGSAGAGGAEG